MIYLFDRLYLESDHYIRNDKQSMAALLGPCATQAKTCTTLEYDFNKIQLDESIADEDLAAYLKALLVTADGSRVVVYTDDDTLIKIVALYCNSVFANATPEFVKTLIAWDKTWVDNSPGFMGHRDFSLRNKGFDELDVTNIDQMVEQGLAISNKLTGMTELRLEYMLANYLNDKLSPADKTAFEQKMLAIFLDGAWSGQLVKTISPMVLTFLADDGIDLDTVTVEMIKSKRREYYDIFNKCMTADPAVIATITAEKYTAFLARCKSDFGWEPNQSYVDAYQDICTDAEAFVKKYCLTPAHMHELYVSFDLGKMTKINPYLWYHIAGTASDTGYLDQFALNV
jgi:hypothetical protein